MRLEIREKLLQRLGRNHTFYIGWAAHNQVLYLSLVDGVKEYHYFLEKVAKKEVLKRKLFWAWHIRKLMETLSVNNYLV